MSLLIHSGTLITIADVGAFQGDIRIDGETITEVTAGPEKIKPAPEDVSIDASGLYVTPGFIDIFVNASADDLDYIVREGAASGVTSMLIWNEAERCTLYHADQVKISSFLRLDPTCYSDVQLDERLHAAEEQGLRAVIDVQSEAVCRRIMLSIRRTGIKPYLFRMSGCTRLAAAIAESGCPVIPAPYGMCGSSPWHMTARLHEMHTVTALTCAYPYTSMKHLPLCAALCVRQGMERNAAMRMITSMPAELLGLPKTGRIKPGFRADLNIYDGDPLLIASSRIMTIVGGHVRR